MLDSNNGILGPDKCEFSVYIDCHGFHEMHMPSLKKKTCSYERAKIKLLNGAF